MFHRDELQTDEEQYFSLAQVVKLLIAAAVLFTYGLQYFVPLEIIWNSIQHSFSHKYAFIAETLMRIGMVMITGKASSF